MITPEEFKREWKLGELIQSSPDILSNVHIPLFAKQFLIQSGLPRRPLQQLRLERLRTELSHLVYNAYYYKIGDWYYRSLVKCIQDGYLCINEQGKIYSYFLNRNPSLIFTNSSVQHLAECFLAYETLSRDLRDNKSYEEGDILLEQMVQVDESLNDFSFLREIVFTEEDAIRDRMRYEFVDKLETRILHIDPKALSEEWYMWATIILDYRM